MKNKPLPNDVATLQALLAQQQEQINFFKIAFEEQKKQDDSDPHPPAGENKPESIKRSNA